VSGIKYRADIDGLRAIAILPVMLFHAGIPGFSGGYVGVDIFFVISGFLIVGIISKQIDEGGFHLGDFWFRRIKRLFPALAIVVAVTLLASYLALYPAEFKAFGRSLIAQALFSINFFFYSQEDYFSPNSELMPLLHGWSLAVEEQFYLLCPIVLMIIGANREKVRIALFAVALLLSFAIGLYLMQHDAKAAFYLPFGRAWELLAGGLLAIAANDRQRLDLSQTAGRIDEAAGWLGLALILVPIFAYSSATPFPGVAAVAPVLGATLIIHAGGRNPHIGAARLLAHRGLVWIGLISYPLYLWHWPVIVFARYANADHLIAWSKGSLPLWQGILVVLLSIALAWATFAFVERPVRSGSAQLSRRKVFTGFAAVTGTMALTGAAIEYDNGGLHRYEPNIRGYLTAEVLPTNRCGHWTETILRSSAFCRVSASASGRNLMIIGDSHAGMFAKAIGEAAQRHGIGALITRGSCHLDLAEAPGRLCGMDFGAIRDTLADNRVVGLVLAYRLDSMIEGPEAGGVDAKLGYAMSTDQQKSMQRALLNKRLAILANDLRSLPVPVALVQQVPLMPFYPPRKLASAVEAQDNPAKLGKSLAVHRERMRFINTATNALVGGNVSVVDTTPMLCSDGFCPAADAGGALYRDEDHLAEYGARRIIPVIDRFISVADRDGRTP